MEVTVRQTRVRVFLIDVISTVALAGLGVEIARHGLGFDDPYDLVPLFSLSYEGNVPTWLSSCMHVTSATLLALIATGKRQSGAPFVRHWWGLSIIFAYISIDEFVTIHEEMNAWFDLSGALYFGWVIPAAILVSIFVLAYWRFLAHLPRTTRIRFIQAGTVFVGGALGVELVLGYWTDLHGSSNLGYGLIDWVEESMELTGAGLFLSALVEVLAGETGQVRLLAGPPPPTKAASAGGDPPAATGTASKPMDIDDNGGAGPYAQHQRRLGEHGAG